MATQKRGTVSAKTIRWIWLICFAPVVLVVVMMTLAATGAFGRMPSFEELENPNYKFATQIISSDGKLLSTYSYSRENRVWTDYKDLSPALIEALISTEDVRFTEHSGIDLRALLRAMHFYAENALVYYMPCGALRICTGFTRKSDYHVNDGRNSVSF